MKKYACITTLVFIIVVCSILLNTKKNRLELYIVSQKGKDYVHININQDLELQNLQAKNKKNNNKIQNIKEKRKAFKRDIASLDSKNNQLKAKLEALKKLSLTY